MEHKPHKLKVRLTKVPRGEYTGKIAKIRKVRNKTQYKLTFQIDKPKGVIVELVEGDSTSFIGKTVKCTPPNDPKER
jgi:hypothetical protein